MKEFKFGGVIKNQLTIILKNDEKIKLILSQEETEEIKKQLVRILVSLNLTEYLLESFEKTIDK